MHRTLLILTSILGALEALLLARLVLRLLAARPENATFAALFVLTAPFRMPLAWLDAGQPRFGGVLELSTLAACGLVAIATLVLAVIARLTPRRKIL